MIRTMNDVDELLKLALEAEEAEEPAPVDSTGSILQELVNAKYALMLAYAHYGDQLRDLARDGLHTHFNRHSAEEREQAYQLNKKLTALGGAAHVGPVSFVEVDVDDISGVLEALLAMERKSVELWTELFHATQTSDVALNGMAQNGAVECQGHADDLIRYLRSFQ